MLIMALDLAVKTGFCIGRAGGKPRAGSVRLKSPHDPSSRACRKLGIWLRDQFAFERPDLVVIEAPVNIGAMIDWKKDGEKPSFRSTPETISLLHRLVGGVETICGPYGIRCGDANVQTVRKHFIGRARPENPKQVVLDRCRLLGYVDRDFSDTDAADAIALWDWACATHARVQPRELVMFEEPR
jgi:hypothetical protein